MHPQDCRPDRKVYIRGQGSERYIRKWKQTEENDDCPCLPTQPAKEGRVRPEGTTEALLRNVPVRLPWSPSDRV